MSEYVLGIDTSNYTTSVALTDKAGNIVYRSERLLETRPGQRGLRQSEAFFQHNRNLPQMLGPLRGKGAGIRGVAVSSRPRPVTGSYMPVFTAGAGYGKAVATVLDVPYMEFSHQEGHIEAVKFYSPFRYEKEILAFHLSGGTCEFLKAREKQSGYDIDITGGSKDISLGQVIDRVGVARGLDFPAGKALDGLAVKRAETAGGEAPEKRSILTPVTLDGTKFNLSGLETQAIRSDSDTEDLALALFREIGKLLVQATHNVRRETGIKNVIYVGGVSSSSYIRKYLENDLEDICFGELSTDNSVGTALLGGKEIWL